MRDLPPWVIGQSPKEELRRWTGWALHGRRFSTPVMGRCVIPDGGKCWRPGGVGRRHRRVADRNRICTADSPTVTRCSPAGDVESTPVSLRFSVQAGTAFARWVGAS